ncbi:hypothetical protein ASPWEDRAFT_562645 [Aspergillus wentii DTO 134E9]|uniref:Uncharacterized protein n=1 Tax=Aspergillus wentii DTO 134E9 TaxID=1073089 RepID=A0A1L9RH38_ASPWE|nr:uncharacterized protein ASPWEDRAFT_562645 [Aspergillus wentii DTO 134E9]OJJ34163.1 hypothetical protein ASPWEDRAFT_562645 [Aspergillus wentii DTO 134E9]
MQTAASNATKELQTKEKRIQYLEKKVQSMRDERAAKAREFSEAQQHISRLMGVMGFKANPVEPEASNKHQRPRSNLGPSQAATMRQKANAGEDDDNTQAQVEHSPAESFEPNTPCSTGRNPKRSKGNPWSLDPSPVSHKAGDRRSKDLSSPSHTRQRPERYPLGDADQNSQLSSQQSSVSSHRQSGIYQESQDCTNPDENRLQDIDLDMDLESSKDFIFTSTSLSEANDHLLARETQQ